MTPRRLTLSLLPAFLLTAALAAADAPKIDFDGALDAGSLLRRARESSAPVPAREPVRAGLEYDRDCTTFDFEPGGPSVSPSVTLSSREYIEECRWVPGGRDGRGGWRDCWRRPGWTYRERVQVEIANRQPTLPWETERFEVCLEGRWLHLRKLAAAYDYSVQQEGGRYTLVPGRKLPMRPDPAGINAGRPANAGSSLVLDFTDRWARHYGAGEKTVLHVAVYREVEGWFDPLLAEAEVVLDPADAYRVDFAAIGAALEPGKTYYAKWGFKRLGSVSTDAYMDRGETGRERFVRIEHQAAAR